MPISVTCKCGRRVNAPESFAGKKVKCPACQSPLQIPAPTAADDEYRLADEPAPQAPAAPRPAAPAAAPLSAGPATEPASGQLDYFLAGYDRVFRTSKLFRVYQDGDELLFVHAGPFHRSMIEGYQAQYAKAIQRGAMAGLSGGAGGSAVGAGAMAAGLAIDWLAGMAQRHAVAHRAKQLDAMNLEQLRQDVASNKVCFRVSGQNVDSAVIEAPRARFWSVDENGDIIRAYLRFKHRPTGMWHMQIMTDRDVALAVAGMHRALAGKPVKVDLLRDE